MRQLKLHWLLLAIAIMLTTASILFSIHAPYEPASGRGLLLVLTATAVAWILWGQMVHADRQAAREDADEYLKLIARCEPTPFRRRTR